MLFLHHGLHCRGFQSLLLSPRIQEPVREKGRLRDPSVIFFSFPVMRSPQFHRLRRTDALEHRISAVLAAVAGCSGLFNTRLEAARPSITTIMLSACSEDASRLPAFLNFPWRLIDLIVNHLPCQVPSLNTRYCTAPSREKSSMLSVASLQ